MTALTNQDDKTGMLLMKTKNSGLAFLLLAVAVIALGDFPCPFKRELRIQNPPLRGKDVRVLQNLIIRSPFVNPKITLNNVYDSETVRAVRQFQEGHHIDVELGVFEEKTAQKLLKLHTYDHYKDDGKILPGYKYKVYLPVHENRSIETIGFLYDAHMNLLYKFNARAHGQNDPRTGDALGQFCTNGNTPTGLFKFDLNSPEDDPVDFGPYPVNRVVEGLAGNGFAVTNNADTTIRNGILLHTGEWKNWDPSKPMPNSEGCIHSYPWQIKDIWQILVHIGVEVRNNTDGKLPYPYPSQGLISIEQID